MDNVLRGPLREILKAGLLVDDDRILVEETLQSGVKYRSGKTIFAGFLVIALLIYFSCGLCESNGLIHLSFGLKVFLNIYIVVGLYILHILLIPSIVKIAANQFSRVDYRYHSFIAQVRQNESSIYGIQHQLETNYVYAKESRKRCIEELRKLVDETREFNCQFPSDIPSIDEFITEELRILSEIGEEIQIDHLQFNALKALWQFMYLQRSEALRNFIIYHHDECNRLLSERSWWSLLRFSRLSLLNFVKFTWSISQFEVHMESIPNTQSMERVKAEKPSDLDKVTTQLEYLLDSFHQMDSLPNDRTPIISTLLSIASSLEKTSMKTVDYGDSVHDDQESEQETENYNNLSEERPDEYEVYEAFVDKSVPSTDEYVSNRFVDPLFECRRDLQAELKQVLVERKKQTQELELKALAKQRNQTVDEVRKDLEKESKSVTKREERPIHSSGNPNPVVSQQELSNAIRKRFSNQPRMETIGDSSESE